MIPYLMITAAEIRKIAGRWRRATRPLKIHDQKYGSQLAAMLTAYDGGDMAWCDDPLEAALFIVLTGLIKEQGLEVPGARGPREESS